MKIFLTVVAKQEAFEEKIRLKNQFRTLDEDEVEFLDSLLESTRAEEENIKEQTAKHLELFRRQREQTDKAQLEGSSADNGLSVEDEDWRILSRKRRREKTKERGENLLPGKKRKSLTANSSSDSATGSGSKNSSSSDIQQKGSSEEKPTDNGKGGCDESKSSGPSLPQKSEKAQNQSDDKSSGSSADAGKKKVEDGAPADARSAAKPTPLSLGLAGYSSESE